MDRIRHEVLAALLACAAASAAAQELQVRPAEVRLEGAFAQTQLLVTKVDAALPEETREDLTGKAKFEASEVSVVSVDANGRLTALRDGQAVIVVTLENVRREVPVTVSGVRENPEVKFTRDVRPILAKSGCAMAACHAAQHGQGGFKLSVFGFDPEQDWAAMTRESFGRRTNVLLPEQSLLLLKPSASVPHGGGQRVAKDSLDYRILRGWIEGGAKASAKDEPQVKRITVQPSRRVTSVGATQQIRAEAEYSDGTRRDVTAWARFDTTDDGVATVTPEGRVTTKGAGQGAIMVRFEGQAEISLMIVPYTDSAPLAEWRNHNFVDELAAAKFRELKLEPSELCDDSTFIRRAFFDALGTPPTVEETQAFLQSTAPDKRTKLVDELLGFAESPRSGRYNEAYSAYWALRWSDLINNSSRELGAQGMWALHNWIRSSFRANKPLDGFVRELITAKGSMYSHGPANFFRLHRDSSQLAEATAQIFLGVRLECAKCHHHPFEKYGQEDYYSLAAYFSRVGTKTTEEFGLFGGESILIIRDSGDVRHPKSGQVLLPKPLEGPAVDNPLDRRLALAEWLTSRENAMFSRSVANRYVKFLLGRGLVEPVDDLRGTNPPSNPPLLEALARHFTESHFNPKQLMRTIMQSRLYQLSSQPTPANAKDGKFYSHFLVKRLTAEPLADAVDFATGVPTKYKNLPLGTRAIELPDAEYPDYFLNTFAKPRRASICECERSPDPSLTQTLHLLNGDTLTTKIADPKGRLATLAAAGKSHDEIIADIYLAVLCRPPTEADLALSRELLSEAASPEECYQDLLWALLNSKHFLFVR